VKNVETEIEKKRKPFPFTRNLFKKLGRIRAKLNESHTKANLGTEFVI
jgi:hypothetical protein